MPRPIVRLLILFGVILSSLVAIMAFARRDAVHIEWILYSVEVGSEKELYAILPDGTHQRKIATMTTFLRYDLTALQPGWVLVQNMNPQDDTELVMATPLTQTATLFFPAGHLVYPIPLFEKWPIVYFYVFSLGASSEAEVWRGDMQRGGAAPLTLAVSPQQFRHHAGGSKVIVWSEGDLYQLDLASPAQLTRLTTRGDISDIAPTTYDFDWVYFFGGDDSLSLYRMRLDGSDEQLIAADVVAEKSVASYYSFNPSTKIYFWTSDTANPTLIEANPDGSDPRPIPNPPQDIQVHKWSPDRIWLYFEYLPTEANVLRDGTLYRFNIQTGETQSVLEDFDANNIVWSPDGATFYHVNRLDLYRVQSDGSQVTLIKEGVTSNGDLVLLEQSNYLAFADYDYKSGYDIYLLDLDTQAISRGPFIHAADGDFEIEDSFVSPVIEWKNGWQLALGSGMVFGIGLLSRIRHRKVG